MNQPNFDASSDPHRKAGKGDAPRASAATGASAAAGASQRRENEVVSTADGKVPFLGIHFKCCGTYGRIYRNRERYVYEGRCPKCRRLLTVPIGPGGLDSRFLTAQ